MYVFNLESGIASKMGFDKMKKKKKLKNHVDYDEAWVRRGDELSSFLFSGKDKKNFTKVKKNYD